MHFLIFNFQMLLILASFEFLGKVLGKALRGKLLSELVRQPAGLRCDSIACAVL